MSKKLRKKTISTIVHLVFFALIFYLFLRTAHIAENVNFEEYVLVTPIGSDGFELRLGRIYGKNRRPLYPE